MSQSLGGLTGAHVVVFGVQQAHNDVRPHPAIYIHLRDELCVGAIHDTEVTNHGLDGSS